MKNLKITIIVFLTIPIFSNCGLASDWYNEFKKGNHDEANNLFWQYVGKLPNMGEGLVLIFAGTKIMDLIVIVKESKKYQFGIDVCTKGLKLCPQNYSNLNKFILQTRAGLYTDLSDYKSALLDYKNADDFISIAWMQASCPDKEIRNGDGCSPI